MFVPSNIDNLVDMIIFILNIREMKLLNELNT